MPERDAKGRMASAARESRRSTKPVPVLDSASKSRRYRDSRGLPRRGCATEEQRDGPYLAGRQDGETVALVTAGGNLCIFRGYVSSSGYGKRSEGGA